MNSIRVDGVNVSYGNKRVLSNIYLNIEHNSIYGLIGPNGAGKSTLFKAILGLIEPSSGFVEVLGDQVDHVRNKIAYVPQKDEVDWSFPAKVVDIVLMGRYPHKKIFQRLNSTDERIALEALKKVNLVDFKNKQIGKLSGGQQQRVFIARALCQDADIFLLDEPFVGVDITTETNIMNILKELSNQGKTVIIIHHDLASVTQYFDKVILLNQRLIAYGDTERVFTQLNIAKTYSSQLNFLHKIGIKNQK